MATPPPASKAPVRAAQYVRMSTEHQRYSIDHQTAAIAQYAAFHGYEVVRTYADAGISGLTIQKRKGLQQLLADVLGGFPGFEVILVYDISRWGRFQNPDQSAHYEFLCTEAGVRVEYCGELFQNDGSLSSTILKNLKRAMAAEYSRELSVKVSAARLRMLKAGYWGGSSPGYGLRRRVVEPDGSLGLVLECGQRKALQAQHTVLVPGPSHEVAVVGRIYRMFVTAGHSRTTIAEVLNAEGVPAEAGRPWTFHTVNQVLSSRKYIGELIGNRYRYRLGGQLVKLPRSEWIRLPNRHHAIVNRHLFEAAAKKLVRDHKVTLSRDRLIEIAKRVYARHGKLTHALLVREPDITGRWVFHNRFHGLAAIYQAIGASPPTGLRRPQVKVDDAEALRRLADLYQRRGRLNSDLINAEPGLPHANTYRLRFGGLKRVYALVGYIRPTANSSRSPVSRARAAAADLRAQENGGLSGGVERTCRLD